MSYVITLNFAPKSDYTRVRIEQTWAQLLCHSIKNTSQMENSFRSKCTRRKNYFFLQNERVAFEANNPNITVSELWKFTSRYPIGTRWKTKSIRHRCKVDLPLSCGLLINFWGNYVCIYTWRHSPCYRIGKSQLEKCLRVQNGDRKFLALSSLSVVACRKAAPQRTYFNYLESH